MAKVKDNKMPKKKRFKCTVCNKAFSERAGLLSHLAVHSDDTPFACPLCPYKGKTKKYLARHHKQVHTERNQHKCTYCGKFFVHPSDLREHIMVHTGEKPLACNVCGKTFRVSYSLNSHMLIHKDEKPFRCSFCEYACRDSSSLRKHQNKHMGLESVYQCKICSKGYKSKWKLKIHVAEVHLDVDVKKVPCGQCDKKFKTISTRNYHVRLIHKRALSCTCPVCGIKLASKYQLSEHMRRHMDDRPFVCTHPGCGVAFKNKGCLQKHSKIHDPSKHFACSHCGRKFVRKSHVAQHERVMHEQRARSVQCDYCGAKFYSKNYLLKHIQTKHVHKHRFKYICDICGLKTHNKPSIVMHLKYGHLNDNDLQCKLCDNKVVYKKHAYLKSHYWRTHNVRYKIDSRRIFKHNKEETKPNVEIKVESIEAESYEEIQLLDVQKQEVASEEDNESLDYSKQVLSEDITALVLRNGKVEGKEVDFDDFFIKHIMAKQEEKPDETISSIGVNKEQDECVKRKINQILIRTRKLAEAKALRKKKKEEERLRKEKAEEEARMREEEERQEILELRRVRELYNEKMRAAAEREKQKKEKVKIKHFRKKPDVNTVTVIDDADADLNRESTENDKATNNSAINHEINDGTDDDDDNTPLNSLVTKINSSIDEHVDDSINNDVNVNILSTERYLEKELNDKNTVTENMDVDKDLNTGNIIFIENKTFMNRNEDVISPQTNTNEIDLTGQGDTVQSGDVSDVNNFNFDKHEILAGSKKTYTDHTYINSIDKGNQSEENNYEKQDNVEKNHDHTYVKNNNNNASKEQDQQTTKEDTIDKELIGDQVSEVATVTENDLQQSKIDSNNVGNDDAAVNTNDENNDNEIINNGNNVTNNENEILNNDSDFDKPLIERKRKHKKRSRKEDSDYEDDDKVACKKKAKKMEFKTHQCYVCFKLYQTKKELINHCQEHFDICNERTLAKCPICNHVSYKVAEHMKRKHKIRIKIPFNKIKDRKTTDGSRYCYEIDGGEIEVIPSIKILNKTASIEIDKKRREKKDKSIATTKLIKKGGSWIVEKEYLDLTFDELPELTDIELTKCKVTGNDIDRLGQISRIAKKKGLKMMFPCFNCDKVCQNFSALKLHKRRHEDNPKPFAPRIKNGARSVKKETKIKLDKGNRTALPKPIKTNHKCDDKLKEFFKSNIRGGDIEFWQFLKIFNKMDREKINDFKDLEERSDFGNHLDYYKDDDEEMNDEMVDIADKYQAEQIDKYIEGDDSEMDEVDEIGNEVDEIDDEVDEISDEVFEESDGDY